MWELANIHCWASVVVIEIDVSAIEIDMSVRNRHINRQSGLLPYVL